MLTRDQIRSRRKRSARAQTLSRRQLISDRAATRRLRVLHEKYPQIVEAPEIVDYPDDVERPRTRGDCLGAERPCPFVSCRWNLYLDVSSQLDNGSITLNFPDLEPGEMEESCALDVADRGGVTLERVGELLNVTRERARQLEALILEKLLAYPRTAKLLLELGDALDAAVPR